MLITNASRLGDFFVIFFLRAESCAELSTQNQMSLCTVGLAIADDP